MTTSAKRMRMLTACLTIALPLTACSGGDAGTDSGGGEEGTSITFVGADPAETFTPLIEAFEAEHPDIAVEYQNVPFDQFNSVIQQRVGGKDPGIDVMYVDAGAVGYTASRGWLEDLSEFQDTATEQSLPAAVEGNVVDDALYALPMWTSSQYLYYNPAALEAAGAPVPSADPAQRITWEQIVESGRAAQAAGTEWGLLFDQTDRYYQLQALTESAGGGSGATGEDLLTADVTNEGWLKAMTFYAGLFQDGVSPRGVETEQMVSLFAAGKAAYFVGGPWSAGVILEENPDLTFGVAPHPAFEGGTVAMPTGSWSLGVSSASDEKEAAKQFVEFASLDPEGNAAAVEEIIIPPTNQSAFDAYIARLDGVKPPSTTGMGALTLSELRDAAVNRPNTVGFVQMQDVLGRAFADIRNGEDVEATLTAAEAELQSIWDRLE